MEQGRGAATTARMCNLELRIEGLEYNYEGFGLSAMAFQSMGLGFR